MYVVTCQSENKILTMGFFCPKRHLLETDVAEVRVGPAV